MSDVGAQPTTRNTSIKPRDAQDPVPILVRGICCGADPHHVRAMAEALGREVPASRYWPSMELHPRFRAEVSAKDAAFLCSRTA